MIDSHCHIDFPEFDADRAHVLASCAAKGVDQIVVPGVSATSWPRLLKITRQNAQLLPALGLHPMFLHEHQESHLQQLDELLAGEKVVAVGEIGLDFYVEELDRDAQQFYFEEQIKLAKKHRLPVILHVRKAHDEVLSVLRKARLCGGIAHAFSGSRQQAEHYLALGFKLGFGGAMTHSRAQKLQRLARELPLSALVLETDAPDMPPAFQQGGRNTPENIPRLCAFLAELRNISSEETAQATTNNLRQVLQLAE